MPRRLIDAQREYDVGTGGDDIPRLNQLLRDAPDGARIELPWRMQFHNTWKIGPGREGLRFSMDRDPRQGRLDEAITWNGPPNGTVVQVDRSTFCEFSGFTIDMGTADCAFDLDSFDPDSRHIGSSCTIDRFAVIARTPRPSQSLIRLSRTATTNQERNALTHGLLAAYAGADVLRVDTTAGSNVIRGDDLATMKTGKRLRIDGCGPGGKVLETSIRSIDISVKPPAATLTDRTLASRREAYAIAGEGVGTAIDCGNNPNAHKTTFQDLNISGFARGIRFGNGGYCAADMQFSDCEVNWEVVRATQPCYEIGTRTERSRRHMINNSATPLTMVAPAYDLALTEPDHAFIENLQSGPVTHIGWTLERGLPSPSTRFWDSVQGRKTIGIAGRFDPAITLAQFGNTTDRNGKMSPMTAKSAIYLTSVDTISDLPGGTLYGFPVFGTLDPLDANDIGPNQAMLGIDPHNGSLQIIAKTASGSIMRERFDGRAPDD